MAITDLKFTEGEFVNNDISSLPNQVTGQAAFLKAKFDNIGKNMVALGKFNALIDALVATGSGVDASKLGSQIPAYYAKQSKVEETTSGTITVTAGTTFLASWQRRNGWVRLGLIVIGIGVGHNVPFANIIGTNGLPNAPIISGQCRLSNGTYMPCIIDIDTITGQIKARNNSASTMADVTFDVTVPAKNV